MKDLEEHLPYFGPIGEGDDVIYTRIEEAQASSVDDVSSYLKMLKEDFMIGQEGHPNTCVVCGDQQTYSIITNLKMKFPTTFSWIVAVPGDWHLLKLASETIRDMIPYGGLRDLCKMCGYHKDINQWRDIHNMILSIHEVLSDELVQKWQQDKEMNDISFESFCDKLLASTNPDEVSRFWASTYNYLCAYMGFYFSIRSGNWQLKNTCLPKLSELFFAYSHNKYEELVCKSMKNSMQLPQEVLNAFLCGEWTVSAKSIPYHSQAMDEAHESMVNKSKDLTTRPTLYRIVELSNFMAVLNHVVNGMTQVLNKFRVEQM